MKKDIQLLCNGTVHTIPNRWESLTSAHFLHLVADFLRMAAGQISVGEVRINYLCDIMGWNKRKFRNEEQIANLVAISEQLTFMFRINYPDNNAVLEGLTNEIYERCRRVGKGSPTLKLSICRRLVLLCATVAVARHRR